MSDPTPDDRPLAGVVTMCGRECVWCATPTDDLVLCRGAMVCRVCAETEVAMKEGE